MKVKCLFLFLSTLFFSFHSFGQSNITDSIFKKSNCNRLVRLTNENFEYTSKSFESFIDSLKVSVSNCDSTFVKSHLFENIKSIFDVSGKKNFIDFWEVNDEKSPFWNFMEKALSFKNVKLRENLVLIPDLGLYNKKCFDNLRPFLVLSDVEMTITNNKKIYVSKNAIVYVDQMEESNFHLLAKELSGKLDFVELCNNCKLLVKYGENKGYLNSIYLWPLKESLSVFFEYKNGIWGINSIQIID